MTNKTKAKSVTIDGKTYSSIEKAYKAVKPDVSLSTFRRKLQSGVRTRKGFMKSDSSVVVNGFIYDTPRLAYDNLRPPITFALFYNRLAQGVYDDKLMLPVNPKPEPKKLTVNGIEYPSAKTAYNILKPPIKLQTFYNRIYQGRKDNELIAPIQRKHRR